MKKRTVIPRDKNHPKLSKPVKMKRKYIKKREEQEYEKPLEKGREKVN